MPQTMLALLALMLLGSYSLTQHTRNVHLQRQMIQNEVATIATGVAMARLERIGAKAFDEQTANQPITSASELTPYPFDDGGAQGNDIDDFHETSHVDAVDLGGAELRFKIYTTVTYADKNDPNEPVTGSEKTKYKRVKASVHSLTVPLPDSVYIYRTYACGSRCDW